MPVDPQEAAERKIVMEDLLRLKSGDSVIRKDGRLDHVCIEALDEIMLDRIVALEKHVEELHAKIEALEAQGAKIEPPY